MIRKLSEIKTSLAFWLSVKDIENLASGKCYVVLHYLLLAYRLPYFPKFTGF